MSLYADYLKETGHFDIIEEEGGFVTYQIFHPECNIVDFYVSAKERATSTVLRLEAAVFSKAKEANCKYLSTQVNLRVKEPQRSKLVKTHLIRGMQIAKVDAFAIYLIKEIQ